MLSTHLLIGLTSGLFLMFMFRNRLIFYGEGLLAPRLTLNLEDTPCRLSAAAYSMYSQLTSIAGGCPSIRDPRTRHAVMTGTHQTWTLYLYVYLYIYLFHVH
jgi:hypothetical protein